MEEFSFTTISNRGIVNSEFDLNLLYEIKNWRSLKEVSENFRLFL